MRTKIGKIPVRETARLILSVIKDTQAAVTRIGLEPGEQRSDGRPRTLDELDEIQLGIHQGTGNLGQPVAAARRGNNFGNNGVGLATGHLTRAYIEK